MPELPEAEVAADQLRARVVGARIVSCWIGRQDIVREGYRFRSWYEGSVVERVERRGKSVILGMARGEERRCLVAELGMTGLLLFPSAPVRLPQHTHLRLYLENGKEQEVRYWNPRRFGRVYLLDREGLERYTSRRFGADPLTLPREGFTALIRGRKGRLKPLLMHQQTIAGIGNIYANEILFRAQLHPNRPAHRVNLEAIHRLYDTMQMVLREAIEWGGSSVRDFFAPDGTPGRYKARHLVYGKQGQLCPNHCGALIRRLQGERSSYYCPTCQRSRLARGRSNRTSEVVQ